jgi:hypothetical protein
LQSAKNTLLCDCWLATRQHDCTEGFEKKSRAVSVARLAFLSIQAYKTHKVFVFLANHTSWLTVPNRTFFWRMLVHCATRVDSKNRGFLKILKE